MGVQSFEDIIEGGFIYIDKTRYIADLVSNGRYFFLSRPRRFGKSLLLSTLHAYFEGKRDLFKGLALDKEDVDWTPRPVLHFDLNAENYTLPEGLSLVLDSELEEYEQIYGRNQKDESPAQRFKTLIRKAYDQTGQKVAVLVDEYDKPLLELEDNPELFKKNQATLKSFYGVLKSMDQYICFGMLTGVARFNKVSIFSDVNNLFDISLTNAYADICGWTEEELLVSFKDGIKTLADERDESFEETVSTLRYMYDGYLFAEKGHRLYNPYSVLEALMSCSIDGHWFESATPTFLAKRVKAEGILLPDLNDMPVRRDDLLRVGPGTGYPIGLMFQTGYLTIGHYDKAQQRYILRFPNHEVEIGFADSLYPMYVPRGDNASTPFSIFKFQDDLFHGRPEKFMERLQTLCKEPGYESQNEDNYRNIVWLLCTLCGSETLTERHSYKGRSDLEVIRGNYIYIFEFKYDRSVEEAMAQLHERDYAGRYALDNRKIYLIAANFSSSKDNRGLTGWHIEELKK